MGRWRWNKWGGTVVGGWSRRKTVSWGFLPPSLSAFSLLFSFSYISTMSPLSPILIVHLPLPTKTLFNITYAFTIPCLHLRAVRLYE